MDAALNSRINLNTKLARARQFSELAPDNPIRGAYRLRGLPSKDFTKLRLPADIIEDRALTSKQDESINDFQLFRVEVDLNSILQLDRKPCPFLFGADMLNYTWL